LEVDLAGEKLLLSEDKIIFWAKERTAFIADFHLGKTTHFRKAGIAVPTAIIEAEIERLNNIILKFRPKKIFFLGDLFHSDLNHEWTVFNEYLKTHSEINFILIKGNHDILHDNHYSLSELQIEKEPYKLKRFILSHHPVNRTEITKDNLNICGHLHPGISLKGKGKSYISLPCFYQRGNQIILPAFGRFTGLAKQKLEKDSQIYIVLRNFVKKWH
jgi:DNA ligase-associated metallophosphoesterase